MDDFILKQRLVSLCQEIANLSTLYPFRIVTAESCTAGLICANLTDLPGSSRYVEGGFVTYSNTIKQTSLNISSYILKEFGAVSEQVATEMVQGALKKSPLANYAVSVTGIAGPDGGSIHKPVGLVWTAVQRLHQKPITKKNTFYGNRKSVRIQTAIQALTLLIQQIEKHH